MDHPSLLVGAAGYEDAGVLRLDDERALVLTTDFFPPVVDDPRWFGRIAAANAMSDVFAMGGEALAALNVVGWPEELDLDILAEILAGGLDKVREAGAALAGGHSVKDREIKYGLAVTGIVHPDRFWRNAAAHEGDVVLLTKPVGMGTMSTAMKRGAVPADGPLVQRAMEQMASLNLEASRALRDLEVHAATDVTGFGLVGHGCEMADGSSLTLELHASDVPVFEGALELARAGVVSGGGKCARRDRAVRVGVDSGVDDALADILFDAETSGGLLVAVPESVADTALRRVEEAGAPCARRVGQFLGRGERSLVVRA